MGLVVELMALQVEVAMRAIGLNHVEYRAIDASRHISSEHIVAVGYEFLNYYRREQDKQWTENRNTEIYNRFCDLVVKHYRESREIKYYANLMNLTPKYLSKVIRAATGGLNPGEWIAQYVTAQAKRLIETRATQTLQETAYLLGFSEPSSFYRYFKRVTGMTAKQYREKREK